MKSLVIIGSGLAGYTVAREWRKRDQSTPLIIITRDEGCFYYKPNLSNALAADKTPEDLVNHKADKMASQLNAEIRTHTEVSAIYPHRHALVVEGNMLYYSKLVLALGADPIRLPLAGDAVDGVISVNDLSDYTRFRQALTGTRRVTIIGAGLIGCEFANDLRKSDYEVEVIDPDPQPLRRWLPEAAGQNFARYLAEVGINWHLGIQASSVDSSQTAYRVTLVNGTILTADVVLSAVGLRPRITLAEVAGIQTNRGILTDRYLQTSAEDIYALGDCAEVQGLILPFVMPITRNARALAKTLAGTPTQTYYPAMPVMVKTPAAPTVVAPPFPCSQGQWRVESTNEGVKALFHDKQDHLCGFALVGKMVAEKNELLEKLPPWLQDE